MFVFCNAATQWPMWPIKTPYSTRDRIRTACIYTYDCNVLERDYIVTFCSMNVPTLGRSQFGEKVFKLADQTQISFFFLETNIFLWSGSQVYQRILKNVIWWYVYNWDSRLIRLNSCKVWQIAVRRWIWYNFLVRKLYWQSGTWAHTDSI